MFNKSIRNLVSIYNILIRRLRLVKVQRNILVFLVFLLISIVFWFMQALKENTTAQFTYQLNIINVPKEIIFTSEVPKSVVVTVNGRGWAILQYWSRNDRKELTVDFKDIDKINSKMTLDNNLWKRLTQREYGNNLKFVTALPSELDIYYSNGITKRVPIIFDGKITTESQHLICGMNISPDSADVVAPVYLLDSINEVRTVFQSIQNLSDTLDTKIPLKTLTGIKVIPDSVRLRVLVDLFTEKTLEVPIYCENIPANKVLRTFPAKAKVTFHVSATLFNKISPQDFVVVVDYNELDGEKKKCNLIVRSQPEHVTHLRVNPEQIEYVIEQALE